MNDPGTSLQLMLYPPPNKRTPIVSIILGICGLLIVWAAVSGAKAFHAVKEGSAQAISVGNRFINAMGSHNYQAAHALFTPQVQVHTPVNNLKDMEAMVEKHHGTLHTQATQS